MIHGAGCLPPFIYPQPVLSQHNTPNQLPHSNSITSIPALRLLLLLFAASPPAHAQLNTDYTYTSDGTSITITGYSGPGGNIVIPDTLESLPVTSIGDTAFLFLRGITGASLPDSITNIGNFAFCNTSTLTDISLPPSLLRIGDYAFYDTGLSSVTIPASVTSIGPGPFGACPQLDPILVDEANPHFRSVDGVLFNGSSTLLIQCPAGRTGSYHPPTNVSLLGGYAFARCTNLTRIDLPPSLLDVGDYAF